jgi:hypothetical protein
MTLLPEFISLAEENAENARLPSGIDFTDEEQKVQTQVRPDFYFLIKCSTPCRSPQCPKTIVNAFWSERDAIEPVLFGDDKNGSEYFHGRGIHAGTDVTNTSAPTLSLRQLEHQTNTASAGWGTKLDTARRTHRVLNVDIDDLKYMKNVLKQHITWHSTMG